MLVVAGNVTLDQVKALAEKWFGQYLPEKNMNAICLQNLNKQHQELWKVKTMCLWMHCINAGIFIPYR
ncbi:MAG: hypothetical protein WDM90_03075 [Ferruginibacter sp.]